ncbi:MAG: methylenetetrahydrofolate reductase [Nitrososphaerota archaeon]|nr:methylenetetrahydrofolate reductase [Nitrososphaerota archaeon]MDG6975873.1 methylenetetrahydrofolate reductase [Nitrososphaerota archaeon]MDG7016061.1 methylenetetrahydrofolate reductase [Nitrososphaerota archaeon]
MAFLRVVEVLPPRFPMSGSGRDRLDLKGEVERFVAEVRMVGRFADVVLVANMKNPHLLKMDTVQAALVAQHRTGVEAAPVLVVRDQVRAQFLSSLVAAFSSGLRSVMIAWGDDFPASGRGTGPGGFTDLAEAIREASVLRARSRSGVRLLAPVDLRRLGAGGGSAMAAGRLKAGADLFLAQPPTTDPHTTFDRHSSAIRRAGLEGKVLPGVFPFKDAADLALYEKMFGWKLSEELHAAASGGGEALFALTRAVVERVSRGGFPGVYVSTRGVPSMAERLLT